ncbi:winged helix DNA-binding protein [Streptomyces sp. SJ1-7]|nr:winged helix DNA-binding protein [Streptomyces sp. SJ1-7]
MNEDVLEALRRRSSALFGNRYMAEVVVAVVDLASATGDSPVTVRMVASRTELTDSLVRPVVKRLVEAGLLEPQPQERSRGTYFHEVRRDDGMWDMLVSTCRLLHGTESADSICTQPRPTDQSARSPSW